jgi:hypothetical protein
VISDGNTNITIQSVEMAGWTNTAKWCIGTSPLLPSVNTNPQWLGDANGDGTVNLSDLVLLANAYNSNPGDARWDPACNWAQPAGHIGLTDLVTLAINYHKTYS